MAKAGKFLKERYLNVSILEELEIEKHTVTISHISIRKVGAEQRLVMYTRENLPGLPLNDNRLRDLIGIHNGVDDTDEWRGTKVRLYVDQSVEYEKEAVGGIRIASVEQAD